MADLETLMMKHQTVVASTPALMRMISRADHEETLDESWKKMQNIRVISRFRPPNSVELEEQRIHGLEDIPPEVDSNSITLTNISEKNGQKTKYRSILDYIFRQDCTQKQLFNIIGQPLIEAGLGGFNATLFAYGQTGSGKTYSTFGKEPDGSGTDISSMGLIPRCLVYMFERLEQKCSNASIAKYNVYLQLLQIYNKQLLDLLNPHSDIKLKIKNDFENNSVFVEHLTKIEITSAREALACIVEASKNRIVASHKLNATSSRSHMLVLLKIRQVKVDGSSIFSNINFGDLAGSENIAKAHGKSDKGKGEDEKRKANLSRQEGIAINSSLSALTRCIFSLVKGKHPGYRDSPLTYLLKDSLGGNSKTTLLVCASPHIYNRAETIRTLRFAATAKDVKNKAHVNQTLSLKALKDRIKQLEAENAKLKKMLKKRGKNTEPLQRAIGTRISVALFPSKNGGLVGRTKKNKKKQKVNKKKKEINKKKNGVVTKGKNIKGKGKGKGIVNVRKKKNMKKKGVKKNNVNRTNGNEYESDEYETDSEEEENETEKSQSCWSYMFYCGGDNDEQIEEDMNDDVEYEATNNFDD